jgi:hypothetical protein
MTHSLQHYTSLFQNSDKIEEFAKGTLVIISKIIKHFIEKHSMDEILIEKIIYEKAVLEELSSFEPILIEELYACYKNSTLVVRDRTGNVETITTKHKLQNYMGIGDLEPLFLPLMDKISK